jgi:hypothetical protein
VVVLDDTNLIMVWYSAYYGGTDFTLNGRYLCASKKKNINWTITITRQRSCCITYFVDFTYYKTDITALNAIIKYSLGWALLLPRLLYFFKRNNFSQKHSGDKFHTESRTQNVLTVVIGVLLGATVTLTSIGAGALNGNFILFIPTIGYTKLVGTEIAHAVPLTLVAGLGHALWGI